MTTSIDYRPLIAQAIRKLGSGGKLARYLGITKQSVSQLKTGKTRPSPDHLMALLKLTGKVAALVVAGIITTAPQSLGDVNAAQEKNGASFTRLYIM